MKTEVTFRSTAFNCTEPKPYFVNDSCFGDDACLWLIERLREQGVTTADEPWPEDFGWYFTFEIDGLPHSFILGFQPEDPAAGEQWYGSVERQLGFWQSIFGKRKNGIQPEAIRAIDKALKSAPEQITYIEWTERGQSR